MNRAVFSEVFKEFLSIHPLPVFMVFFYILNLLDYSTTVYALNCIPGAYETNKWIANSEDAFRVKILHGTPIWIVYFFIGIFLERVRIKCDSMFIRFCYFLMLVPVILVVVQYFVTVASNFMIILTYC
jgi:hypothetical protein